MLNATILLTPGKMTACEGFRMPAARDGAPLAPGRRPEAAKERTRRACPQNVRQLHLPTAVSI
jgi:hypothetical protein